MKENAYHRPPITTNKDSFLGIGSFNVYYYRSSRKKKQKMAS